MTEKKTAFYAYRYLVTPISSQLTLRQEFNKSKEELIFDVIQHLTDSNKTEWTKGSKRYLFYGYQQKDFIFIIKLAKETNESIYLEGDKDIEVRDIKEAKFVLLIIDTLHQIILVENNINVFKLTSTTINVLTAFFREMMQEYDYVVNIYPLVSDKKFWNYVETADEIFELSLVMNAPNMPFFGHQDTRDVLQMIKEATNNEEFDIGFKNKHGKLKVMKETLGSWIDYVREVGGRYVLKFSRNGEREVKTSELDTAKAYISKKNEKYNEEELHRIKMKLAKIHFLRNRYDEEGDL